MLQGKQETIKNIVLRLLFFAVSVVLGFVFLELPWNKEFYEIPFNFLVFNGLILASIAFFITLVSQHTRGSLVAFTGLCLFAGCANYFIIKFKGQPILPADLFALGTAASVSEGYTFEITRRIAACVVVWAAYAFAVFKWCPKVPVRRTIVIANVVAALLVALIGVTAFNKVDVIETTGVKVDVWNAKSSFASQGTALCFLSRAQQLMPQVPEGYSEEAVEEILEPYKSANNGEGASVTSTTTSASSSADSTSASTTSTTTEEVKPHVLAIMNETFSDLSQYPGLEESNAQLTFYDEVAADALVSGTTYVSALGGGTCNSEFEFLTGASVGLMGAGIYPYVLYDLDNASSLPHYFNTIGYDTTAIHPASANNWRRDRIYNQLGFDTFDDISTMEGAPTLRNMTTDKATYEHALEIIDNAESPQFIFDVTYQNHSGYSTGLIPEDMQVTLDSETIKNSEIDEYLSSIKQSEEDLRWLISELNNRTDPIFLVFFGDHQPNFADWLFEATNGKSVNDSTLEEVQTRYNTPYFIWANEAARTLYGDSLTSLGTTEVTSLNYVSTLLQMTTGLPSTTQDRYLEDLREVLPAMNLNGYMDADGVWHDYAEEPTTEAGKKALEALKQYRMVQYNDLFTRNDTYAQNE